MAIYGIANAAPAASTTLTVTVGSGAGTLQAPATGDLIYITAGNTGGRTVTSVIDSQGQSYPPVVTTTGGSLRTMTFALVNAKTLVSGTDTFSVTFSGTAVNGFVVVKGCDGVASATADKTAGTNGTGTAPSSGSSGALSQSGELVTGSIGAGSAAGGSPTGLSFGSGTATALTSASHGYYTEFDELVTATTAQTASGTLGTSAAWAASVAAFKLTQPAVTTTMLPGGTVSTAYSQAVAWTGGTSAFTWTVISGSLPAGLTIGSSTGIISGTPTTAGTSSFTVQVTDGAGQTATQALSVTITGGSSLAITTGSLPGGTTGTTYTSGTFGASGGTSPYHFSLNAGSLPPGTAWEPGSGGSSLAGVTIAGVPVQATLAADISWWNANVFPANYQKIYYSSVGQFPAPATLGAASANIQEAVANNIACLLCYKPAGNGTVNDSSWPGGANKPAQGNATTPGTILGDQASLIASVTAHISIGVNVAGIVIYQEADGSKRGTITGGDGLTDYVHQIPYLYYQNYAALKTAFPSVPVISLQTGYALNTDSPARSAYMPCPTPATSPRGLSVATSTGGSFTAGTFFWRVAATDGWGRVYASNEVTKTISGTQSAALTWTNPGAGNNPESGSTNNYTQVQVFRGTTAGAENILVTTLAAGATSFTDTGGAGTSQTLVPTVYCDGVAIDLYGEGFDSQTAASKGRYPYSDSPLTSPGYADIADWNGISFGWAESGNSASGGGPSNATVINYLTGNPQDANSTPSSLANSIQAVFTKRVGAGLPNLFWAWFENLGGTGPNHITDTSDYRIPLLQAIAGTLPVGGTSASVGGTPTLAGTYTFSVQVKDSATPANTALKSFTITVTGAAAALMVTTTSLPAGTQNTAYTASLTSQGGVPPVSWAITSGALPTGITMDSTGNLSGTPTATGTFTVTVAVTDSHAASASATLTISVTTTSGGGGGGGGGGTGGGPALYTAAYQATYGTLPPPPPPGGPPGTTPKVWQFVFATPQPGGTYLAEVAQAQTRSLTLRTGPDQYHEATVDILGTDPAAAFVTELQTDIQVLLNGTILFCGRVGACADQLDATQHRFQPVALDYRELLRRRSFAYGGGPNWSNKDVADIVWGILKNGPAGDSEGVPGIQAYPGGDLGIARGLGAGGLGVAQSINYGKTQMAGDVITQLAQMSPGGFDWDISPYGRADLRVDLWYPSRGADRGVVLEYGGGLVSSIQRTTDPSAFADSVLITGQATGGSQLLETPSPGSAAIGGFALDAGDIGTRPEGRWDQVTGTQISTQSALDASAAFTLASAEVVTPSYVVQLYPGTWQGTSHIWLGDYVMVRIQSGRLTVNDRLRVAEMDFAIDPNGVETLTVTLGYLPFRTTRAIPNMLRRLRTLESL